MKFGHLILRKIITCCLQMSDFNAKMHQNQFRLGLSPRPRLGAYSAPSGKSSESVQCTACDACADMGQL